MKIILFLFALALATPLFAQQNLLEAKSYREGEPLTVSGIVLNGNELGPIRYIQDKTAGVAIYDSKLTDVKRGDSITVSGEVHPYNELFEVTLVSTFSIHASNLKMPEPKIIDIGSIGENYESQLVQINNVEIINASGTFSGETNYQVTANGKIAEFRINKNSTSIIGTPIPTGSFNLVAICSQYKQTYQLLPRDLDDLILNDPINITSPVEISNITKAGFTLSWITDVEAIPQVKYYLLDSPLSWQNSQPGNSAATENGFLNTVEFTGLEPATILFAQAISVSGADSAFSSVSSFATQSNSTGKINIYFNTAVDPAVSTGTLALSIGDALEDSVIAYINRATESIDFCIYNLNNSGLSNVSEALNNAKNRGVKIRFISSGNTAHYGSEELDNSIGVLESPYTSETGIMHNKFIVFDANSSNPEKPWVWTGSTNLSEDQVKTDANNMLFIQDQTLAKTYQIEFEEMWGGPNLQPNKTNSRFGAQKTDNTPHKFMIGEIPVECYFSPSDGTNQQIINAINSADNDLNIETMLITRTDLANTIAAAKQRGVEVHVITDNRTDNAQTVNDILNAALPNGKFVFDSWSGGILHHKLAIIDANFPASDPQVVTGSHNWSFSADNLNDENTLIIHDAEIANIYFQQFASRFTENSGSLYVAAQINDLKNLKIYPNPATEILTISSTELIDRIELFNLLGEKISEFRPQNSQNISIDFRDKKPGIYLLNVVPENGSRNSYKILKQ